LEQPPSDDIVQRINSVLPPGLSMASCTMVLRPVKEIAFAEYVYTLDDKPRDCQALQTFLRDGPVQVTKKTKSGTMDIDLAAVVKHPVYFPEDGVFKAMLPVSDPSVPPLLLKQALHERYPDMGWNTAACNRTGIFDGVLDRF
jgi:hypothetical protein